MRNTISLSDALQTSSCQNNFDVALGSSNQVINRWLLGEFHSRHQNTLDCIEELAEELQLKNYRVLFESIPSGVEVSCAHYGISPKKEQKVTCMGWDDLKGMDRMLEIKAEQNGLFFEVVFALWKKYLDVGNDPNNKNKPRKISNIMDNYIDSERKRNRKEFTQKFTMGYTMSEESITIHFREFKNALNWIYIQRQQDMSYKEIFSILNAAENPLNQEQKQRVIELCKIRNRSLMTALRSFNDETTNFIIGGKSHFFSTVPHQEDCASEYISNELVKDAEHKPFMILSMIP